MGKGTLRPAPYRYKRRMKCKVTALLGFLVIVFALLYVPAEVLSFLQKSLTTAQSLLLRVGVSIPLIVFAQWIIFAQDHLANGTSSASEFFRDCYPSTYAIERYKLEPDRARTLWFDYFNEWSDENHRNHKYYRFNFERSYSLRLIFYLKRLLWGFSMFAIIATGVWAYATGSAADLGILCARLGVAILAGLVALSLTLSNRARPTEGELPHEKWHPTGAYAKFREICGILRVKFDDEILRPHFSGDAETTPEQESRGQQDD